MKPVVVRAAPPTAPSASDAVAALERERLAAVDRHAAAQEENWEAARRHCRALATALLDLENPADEAQRPPSRTVGKLVRAVWARDRAATLHAADRVPQWTAQRRQSEAGTSTHR